MNKKILIILIIMALVATGYSYYRSSAQTAPAPTPLPTDTDQAIVSYTDTGFDPQTITIPAGTTVTFVNSSSGKMWVASASHPIHLILPEFDQRQGSPPGSSYQFTFDQAGGWNLHNHLKPNHIGTVIIQ